MTKKRVDYNRVGSIELNESDNKSEDGNDNSLESKEEYLWKYSSSV